MNELMYKSFVIFLRQDKKKWHIEKTNIGR